MYQDIIRLPLEGVSAEGLEADRVPGQLEDPKDAHDAEGLDDLAHRVDLSGVGSICPFATLT